MDSHQDSGCQGNKLISVGSRFAFLDGIRGLAAVFVLTRHTGSFWGMSFYRSYLAVDLFFVLSGFVIAHAYERKLELGGISKVDFFLIRVIRLYPMYFLSFVCCLSIAAVRLVMANKGSGDLWFELVVVGGLTAVMLPSSFGSSQMLFPLNGPYWSLFFELLTNFLYALVRTALNNRTLLLTVVILQIMVLYLSFENGGLDIGFTWGFESVVAGISRSMLGFFLGY